MLRPTAVRNHEKVRTCEKFEVKTTTRQPNIGVRKHLTMDEELSLQISQFRSLSLSKHGVLYLARSGCKSRERSLSRSSVAPYTNFQRVQCLTPGTFQGFQTIYAA